MTKNREIYRYELPSLLPETERLIEGVELGVAAGKNAEQLLKHNPNLFLTCVDAWAGDRGHNDKQLQECKDRLAPYEGRFLIVQSFFDQYLPRASDGFFDFIYIDGYAHTGQHEGDTLEKAWTKLRPGGLFSGHDYHQDWPLTIEAVDAFVLKHGRKLHLTVADPYPSWYVWKLEN